MRTRDEIKANILAAITVEDPGAPTATAAVVAVLDLVVDVRDALVAIAKRLDRGIATVEVTNV